MVPLLQHPAYPMRRPLSLAIAVAIALATSSAAADKDQHPLLKAAVDHARAERNHRGSVLDRALDRLVAGRHLDSILRDVERSARAGQRPVVVFDIDDTLVKWKKVNGKKIDEWSPMPGGAAYLRAIERAGAQIVYLTARPHSDVLRAETLGLLQQIGVPLGPKHEVMMAPEGWEGSAADGKALAEPAIRAKGRPLAFFDNDHANVRLFRRQYPDATVFRVAGHSAHEDPEPARGLDGVVVVRDYTASRKARQGLRMPRRAATAGPRARLRALPRHTHRVLKQLSARMRAVRPRAHR